jgi:DNA replication and repair protein RecF
VHVTSVEMRDFRSYARAEAHLGPGLTVVYGPNGAGKTNLLEAVYFGCTARSCRSTNEREMVRFGAQATRVVLRTAAGDGAHELSVGFEPGEVKRLRVDGAPVERMIDVESRPLVSVFLPDRLELVKGPPALRRAHMDQVVAAVWPLRRGTRRAYSQALGQRNALLARIRSGRASASALSSWDHELARHAIALREDRDAAVALVSDGFSARASELGLSGAATLEYRPRSRATDPESFVAELEARRDGELERGFSVHGPHRDDLVLLRDGRDLRSYGSQGEQRISLLALLLAERGALADARGHPPVMLLDDVMSELDADRRALLAGELAGGGQSVITTTDLAHVPGAEARGVTRLRVADGAVLGEALAA